MFMCDGNCVTKLMYRNQEGKLEITKFTLAAYVQSPNLYYESHPIDFVDKSYVGETRRKMFIRIEEHINQ